MDEVRLAPNAKECKRVARGDDDKRPRRQDWAEVKDDVMYAALKAKFTQHPQLRETLLGTGDRTLVEHTKIDSYWADGGDGSGKNMLGKLLMKLRDELRSETPADAEIEDESDEDVSEEKKDPKSDTIYFYGAKLNYYEFSNFYPSKFTIEGKEYPTSEHYFQAMKFHESEEFSEMVRLAKTPGIAAMLGRSRDYPLRKDWEEVKDEIMYEGLKAKFTQNSKLKKILLSTGDKPIVEHTKNDHYWGDGGDGTGKNMLGILLMKVRDYLNE